MHLGRVTCFLIASMMFSISLGINETEFCDILSNDKCTVQKNKTIDTNFTMKKSKVEMNNVFIVPSQRCVYKSCWFRIEADSLLLNDVSISSSIIEMNISYVAQLKNVTLSADNGVNQGLGNSQNEPDIKGNSYASWGSSCALSNNQKFYGDPRLLHNTSISELRKLNISGMSEGINSTYLFLGSGASILTEDYFGNGGGRVVLNTTNIIGEGLIKITANGSPQYNDLYNCTTRSKILKSNGGTGGYVFLGINGAMNIDKVTNFQIEALGGNYCFDTTSTTKLAGSGGRIILDVNDRSNSLDSKFNIKVGGGINDSSVNDSSLVFQCKNGGAGTVYFIRNKTLIIDNNRPQTDTCTIYPKGPKVASLQILNGARVCPWLFNRLESKEIIEPNELIIRSAILSYQINTGILNISTSRFIIEGEGGIGKNDPSYKLGILDMHADEFRMSANATFLCKNKTTIVANQLLLETDSKFISISNSYTELIIQAWNNITLNGALIQASKISILSKLYLQENSLVKATQISCLANDVGYKKMFIPTSYPKFEFTDYLNLLTYSATNTTIDYLSLMIKSNYTLFILSRNFSLGTSRNDSANDTSGSRIEGARIGVFADDIFIGANSFLKSDGMGCLKGPGQGVWDELFKCGGTGGSHGGYGGYALSKYENILVECFRIKSKNLYGNSNDPYLEGSGGGCSVDGSLTSGGAGGGVVYVGASKTLMLNGKISSDGSSPSTEAGKAKSGSGSGGSIQIFTKLISGFGTITAQGGSTDKDGIGGPGGGGRVKINLLNWYDVDSYPNNTLGWGGSVSVMHGDTSSVKIPEDQTGPVYLGDGTILSTPCLPGYYGPFCKKCPQGTFKSILGSSECLKCTNKPLLGYYTNDNKLQSTPKCPYRCDLTKTPLDIEENPNCLSESEHKMSYFGGWPGVLAIGMTVAFLVIFILLLILSKKRKSKNSSMLSFKSILDRSSDIELETSEDMSMDFEQKQQSIAKIDFVREDLPFHEKRIYLCGDNSFRKAWFISPDEYLDLSQEIDLTKYNQFSKLFNNTVTYNWFQALSLYLSRILYYPVYFALIQFYRSQKIRALNEIIPEVKIFKDKLDKRKTKYYLKFTATPDNTLTRLDILNYERSVLEWSNTPQYPISIMLAGEGNFLFPFHIVTSDPLLELMGESFKSKLNSESINDYLHITLDDDELEGGDQPLSGKEELKFFLDQVNSKLRVIDFSKNCRDFVNNFFELADYMNYANQNLFKENGVQANIFYHKISIERQSASSGNSIVFLETENKALLEKSLREAHHHKFLNRAISVKFSLNFSKIFVKEFRSSSNDRLQYAGSLRLGYKPYEEQSNTDGYDDIFALKHQIIMKNENETILLNSRLSKNSKDKAKGMIESFSSNFIMIVCKINRWAGYLRAIFMSYRSRRLSHHTITAMLFILIIIDAVVYFSLCFGISYNLFKDIPSIYLFFPLSPFVSPILGIFSVISTQPTIVKIFLMYNSQSIINHLIDFIITVSNRSEQNGPSMILFKFILILTKSLTIPVASAFLTFCDDLLSRRKHIETK